MRNHIAVIPARGGSKRIPRKNIKHFRGLPVIGHVLNKALNSGLFDRVIVSTDDEAIAEVSREFGAETPFLRSPQLSQDDTPTVPVIKDSIQRLYESDPPQFVTAIYPCTPFIEMDDIKDALEILLHSDTKYVFPVCRFSPPPQRGLAVDSNLNTTSINPQFAWTRSQDLEPVYFDAGQFYCGHAKSWLDEVELHNQSKAVFIPPWRAVDIDTPEDWQLAERLYGVSAQIK